MNIERQPQESLMDYHKRLIYGKLVDRTLAEVGGFDFILADLGSVYRSQNV